MITYVSADHTCKHQLVFSAALDHAASCARCGAIALIARRDTMDGAAHITWIAAERTSRDDGPRAAIAAG